jgi:hypothetical protein
MAFTRSGKVVAQGFPGSISSTNAYEEGKENSGESHPTAANELLAVNRYQSPHLPPALISPPFVPLTLAAFLLHNQQRLSRQIELNS